MWWESKQKTNKLIWSEYGCTEILAYRVQYMSFLLALIFYNASLQIHVNIVPHCKDWSIFCFDLADDLVPCKLSRQTLALKMMGSWSPLITVDHVIKVYCFKRARCKNDQQWCSNYSSGRKANRSNRLEYWVAFPAGVFKGDRRGKKCDLP